ncbi:hypothetical protein IVB18_45515 [Bradyrhizobium sp. 186]|uniref:hypothetical protein n=1 Tax=Bradyrhizobium sp. 186 TaxID=2782654 RepID=UPI0020014EAC|nr:hypothetical protein [Bradyrhizobium sp. 186]UPK35158.1 hypothetical protein IVB18_45515 [Bradyrhizobium sp. 186]
MLAWLESRTEAEMPAPLVGILRHAGASTFILGLAGIQPATQPSVSLNIEMRAGYVIDLSDDPPPIRTISHD